MYKTIRRTHGSGEDRREYETLSDALTGLADQVKVLEADNRFDIVFGVDHIIGGMEIDVYISSEHQLTLYLLPY